MKMTLHLSLEDVKNALLQATRQRLGGNAPSKEFDERLGAATVHLKIDNVEIGDQRERVTEPRCTGAEVTLVIP